MYILYTSGSTGEPKGVMQSHRNVLHHIRVYTNALQLHSDDRLSLLPSYAFDAAVMDVFGALLNGAVLCPIAPLTEGLSAVGAHRVSILHATPTLFRHLLGDRPDRGLLSTVRCAVLGGEEVRRQDFEIFRQFFPRGCVFVNGLGPTESTLALQCFLDHDSDATREAIPVGKSVDDTEVSLVGFDGEPVATYGTGEISIRSRYVALGYRNRPELTERAFVDGADSTRVYRTGDVGRHLLDGTIEFLGRRDAQIKIRGYRVELGDVETALRETPGVAQAVVTTAGPATDRRLVAYVVTSGAPAPTIQKLRADLARRLPDYLVPSAMMIMDALPLTPNGKVAYRELPDPEAVKPERNGDFMGPRDACEARLVRLWRDVLGVDRVGVHDNFFDLGGHSLLAARVIARIWTEFGRELPLRVMFESPTVAALAWQVSGGRDTTIQQGAAIPQASRAAYSVTIDENAHLVRTGNQVQGASEPMTRTGQTANPEIELVEVNGESTLFIEGGQAMQAWEADLMRESADILCTFGSEFLEVGLGLGISALHIAGHANTRRHIVVEKYPRVIDLFTRASGHTALDARDRPLGLFRLCGAAPASQPRRHLLRPLFRDVRHLAEDGALERRDAAYRGLAQARRRVHAVLLHDSDPATDLRPVLQSRCDRTSVVPDLRQHELHAGSVGGRVHSVLRAHALNGRRLHNE